MKPEYMHSEKFDVLTQLKTWIAVNPAFGCPWDCAYCIQQKDEFFNEIGTGQVIKAKRANGVEYSPEHIARELEENRKYFKQYCDDLSITGHVIVNTTLETSVSRLMSIINE
jgi:hypothetical protein